MKKRSKRWKEFCQIISIVDIGIGKQQRKIIKLNKKKEQLELLMNECFFNIENNKNILKNLSITKEIDSIHLYFKRVGKIKSLIESAFFDISLLSNEIEQVHSDIKVSEEEKLRLEKRKDILEELKKEIN